MVQTHREPLSSLLSWLRAHKSNARRALENRVLDLVGSGQPLTISAEGKSYVLSPAKVPRWRARFRNICADAPTASRPRSFNLEIEPKNIVPRRITSFEFSHSQGHSRRSAPAFGTSGLPAGSGHAAALHQLARWANAPDAQLFGWNHPNIATTMHASSEMICRPIVIQYRIGAASLSKVHFDGDVNNQFKISPLQRMYVILLSTRPDQSVRLQSKHK
jgi:hypothetical protein